MAQYAHLSDPNPEWLAIASSIPSFHFDNAIEFRRKFTSFWEEANARLQAEPVASEPEDRGVIVTHLDIKRDGYDIPCRTYVPKINLELGEKPGEKFPLLYWSFGGGNTLLTTSFCLGTLDDNDTMLKELALNLRITCVSVQYRLAPEHPFPAGIDDDYAGLKWALANPDSISLDITKGVLVGGLSAGGNFSAVISQRSLKDDQVRGKITGQLLINPILIMPSAYPDKWKSQLLSLEQNKSALILSKSTLKVVIDAYIGSKPESVFDPDMSPLLSPSFKDLPPTYIQVSGADPLRDDSFLYEKILKEDGIQTKLDIYPGVPHAFHAFAPTLVLSKKQDADFRSAIKWLLGRSK